MPITINIRVGESSSDIENKILSSLRIELNKTMKAAAPAIRLRVQDLCVKMIENTEEYKSLLSGELLAELGIPEVNRRLRDILNAIRDSVAVSSIPVKVQGRQLAGGLEIGMIKSGFDDLLRLEASTYISNGRYTIPWLDWLITKGDQIIVLTHEVTFNLDAAGRARSRTGMALMRPGSGWRVPPEYSGTLEDNFITRAFNGSAVADHISTIIEEEIQRRI